MVSLRKLILPLLMLALLGATSLARAQFTPLAQPDANYLANTTKLDITVNDFDVLSSLSNGGFTVAFSSDVIAATVSSSFGSWGAPPNTEDAAPRVLVTQDPSLTLSFSDPIALFGLEAQPDAFGPADITATFLNGANTLGSITLNVDGGGGALLFAAQSQTPFTRVILNSSDVFAIAQIRAGAVVPEPGTLALFVCVGTFGLGAHLRKRK